MTTVGPGAIASEQDCRLLCLRAMRDPATIHLIHNLTCAVLLHCAALGYGRRRMRLLGRSVCGNPQYTERQGRAAVSPTKHAIRCHARQHRLIVELADDGHGRRPGHVKFGIQLVSSHHESKRSQYILPQRQEPARQGVHGALVYANGYARDITAQRFGGVASAAVDVSKL